MSARRRAPHPRRRRGLDQVARLAAENFGMVKRRPGARCAVCGHFGSVRNPLQVHHVVEKDALYSYCSERNLIPAVVVWDTRNAMVVCETCHAAHTNASNRIPRELVTEDNWAFAREHGLDWRIEQFYPLNPSCPGCGITAYWLRAATPRNRALLAEKCPDDFHHADTRNALEAA